MSNSVQSMVAHKTGFQLFAAVASMVVALIVLWGWITSSDALTRIFSNSIAMNPMTAISLVAVSTALLLRSPRTRPLFFGLAALTIFIGITKFLQFALGYTEGIDQLLFVNEAVRAPGSAPNRMAPNTAFAMAALGLGLIISRSRRNAVMLWSQGLCMASAATALAALVGYLLDVVALYQVHNYIAMALPTAAAVLTLSLAIISTNANVGLMRIFNDAGSAGSLARTALPLALLVPIAVSVAGLSGQRAGYYGPEAVIAIALIANVLVNLVLLGGWTIALHGTDSERLRREALITRSDNQYRQSERVGHVGYWKIEFPSRSVQWSRGFARICALREDATSNLETALSVYHPEDAMLARDKLQLAETGGVDWEFPCRISRPDGSVRYITSHGVCERDARGGISEVFGVISDVTDLQLARLDAEAAKATTASFLANMSHEIRTPINGVMGFVELLMASKLDGTQRRHLSLVQESANALLKLLNDILDISKIEAGRLEIADGPYDIRHGVEQCVRLMTPIAEQKGLNLTLAIAEDFPRHVVVDGLRLRQILLNLIGNAIKFTERGSVSVRVVNQIHTGAARAYRLCVEDTGIGIAPERMASIFDAFVQAEPTTTRRFGGTGLGLTISRQLAEIMKGTLEVDSTPGKGTRMTLILPMVSASETQVAQSAAPVEPRVDMTARLTTAGASVLLVEDLDINQELFAKMIGLLGHRLDIAGDGAAAVERAKTLLTDPGKWDLVLMDLQMPVMDGLMATRAIRALGGRAATIPIIALTASAFDEDRRECELAGMNDHLAKPVGIEGLRRMINRCKDGNCDPFGEELGPLRGSSLDALFRERLRTSAERLVAIEVELPGAAANVVRTLVDETRAIAHDFAGSAGMFGEYKLGDRAADVEERIRAAKDMNAPGSMAIVLQAISVLIEALSAATETITKLDVKTATG